MLDKLGKLSDSDMTDDKLKSWDKKLSNYLAEQVKEGILSYKDLMIFDESRKKSVPYYGHYTNVVVCVEKDTVFNSVSDISSLLGCSCISSKGLNSLGATEQLLRQINNRSNGELTDIYFIVLSDYDPAGYDIADTFQAQAKDLLQVLKMQDCTIHSERIGVLPCQLTQEELSNNKYTPKEKGLDKWFKLTNGINGERKGLELDSLEPYRIREIFATSLQNYIDSKVYIPDLKVNYLTSKIRDAIQPYIDNIVQEIAVQKIHDVVVKDFDILDLMKQGYSYIPKDKLCSLKTNDLSELAKDYFIA